MRWLLLVLSMVSICLTIGASRWQRGAKDIPWKDFSSPLGGDRLDYLSLAERERMRESLESGSWGLGGIVSLFAAVSVVLVFMTIRAFVG